MSASLLQEVSMEELESLASESGISMLWPDHVRGRDSAWICFEASVRSAHATALAQLRAQACEHPRYDELLRLVEIEEVTRCQCFQAALMGEVREQVYQSTVKSILEKLLAKLETLAPEMWLYQGAAQCLSVYMSSLNHHCDLYTSPRSPGALPKINEVEVASYASLGSASDYAQSEGETDTLSVHSDAASTCSMGPMSVQSMSESRPAEARMVDVEQQRAERRRESNKKAASKYRSKKTTSMSQLMAENAEMRTRVTALSSQTAVLSAENKLLKQQVAFLQSMLSGKPPQTGLSLASPDSAFTSAATAMKIVGVAGTVGSCDEASASASFSAADAVSTAASFSQTASVSRGSQAQSMEPSVTSFQVTSEQMQMSLCGH